MKGLGSLVWLTRLGISVAAPLALCVWGAVWLRGYFRLGVWVILVGTVLGLYLAVDGLRNSLKLMERMSRKKQDPQPPTVSFNDHD